MRRLASLGCCALLLSGLALAADAPAEKLRAVRVWPAPEYTRVTLESAAPLQHRLITIKGPERLVLDLEGVDFPSAQQAFADKVSDSDPYIGSLRVGRFKPGVVRVVLGLSGPRHYQVVRGKGAIMVSVDGPREVHDRIR